VEESTVIGARELGHVALRARDFDTLYDFYTNKLGFPEFLRFHNSEGKLRLVYLRITDTQCIELFPDAVGEPPPKNHPGVFHICINVDDLDATLADLASRGVPFNDPAKSTRADGNRASGVTDPEGNYLELIQMLPTGAQTQAMARFHAAAR
jgi:lactoylglutathione lyase